jgi:hypothetical protein
MRVAGCDAFRIEIAPLAPRARGGPRLAEPERESGSENGRGLEKLSALHDDTVAAGSK